MTQRLYVKTFGCQMNEYDSERVFRLLAPSHTPVGQQEDADLVLINTCSVREKGEHKLFSLLGELRELKQIRPELKVGVMGCVAQQEGEAILRRSTAVDFVVGTHNLSLIPGMLSAVQSGMGPQVAVDYRDEWEDLPLGFADQGETLSRTAENAPSQVSESGSTFSATSWMHNHMRALVSIQRGCNKNCSYCVVPTTRGKELSRDPKEILREVTLKARLGAKEVLLLGQTVNSYGKDLSPRFGFEKLIAEIAAVSGIERIRFTSPHPAEVRKDFLDLYSNIPQLMPHIHLPMQSGSDRVLKLMNRNYRAKRYLQIVEEVRARMPNIAITTDIIVGFPTETEEDFEKTLAMMTEVGFESSFSFKYSRRPNTTAISDYSPAQEIAPEVSQSRLARVQNLQEQLSEQYHSQFLDSTTKVLLEGVRDSQRDFGLSIAWGRTPENVLVEVMDSVPLLQGNPRQDDAFLADRRLATNSQPVKNPRSQGERIQRREIVPGQTVEVLIHHTSSRGMRGVLFEGQAKA